MKNSSKLTISCLVTLFILGFFGTISLHADSVDVTVAADTDIRRNKDGASSATSATATTLRVGSQRTANNYTNGRALLSFDLNSFVPANATINSVTLNIYYNGDTVAGEVLQYAGPITLGLYVLPDAFTAGQATWDNSSTGTPWTAGAGGLADTASALATATGYATVTGPNNLLSWSGTELLGYVSTQYASGSLVSFAIKSDIENSEYGAPTYRGLLNLFSSETGTANRFPRLTIDYTVNPVPEPSTWAVVSGVFALIAAVLWRRCR
ncbi:hypothetical protein OPIT5_17785 [Opitutaceae bacterium TAV5]|nr:hypothetical protein OPIT5_17785 [Opitutaceae bacterium TAV5]